MTTQQLALLGGKPTITAPGPHFPWPIITPDTERAVVAQLWEDVSIYNRSGIFTRFEDAFRNYHNRRYGLVTSSGTMALYSMFQAIGIKAGDEVICPAYTFYATATPLYSLGAIPVLCDSDETGNIDPDKIESLVTDKTRAVIVTHMWGIPVRQDEVAAICKAHGLRFLEDCSHAHGATYRGNKVGSISDAAAWSLQGQKIITGGEGGIVLTDDPEIYARLNMAGQYNKRCKQEIPSEHWLQEFAVTGMGLKLRAHPLAIAMAMEQFGHLDGWLSEKRRYAALFNQRLSQLPGIRVPTLPEGADPAWYAYVFHYQGLPGVSVDRFFQALQAEGAREADMPGSTCPLNHLPLVQRPWELFPSYARRKRQTRRYKVGDFPAAELFFEGAIKLPVWVRPQDELMVESYIEAIEKVVLNSHQLS